MPSARLGDGAGRVPVVSMDLTFTFWRGFLKEEQISGSIIIDSVSISFLVARFLARHRSFE